MGSINWLVGFLNNINFIIGLSIGFWLSAFLLSFLQEYEE